MEKKLNLREWVWSSDLEIFKQILKDKKNAQKLRIKDQREKIKISVNQITELGIITLTLDSKLRNGRSNPRTTKMMIILWNPWSG